MRRVAHLALVCLLLAACSNSDPEWNAESVTAAAVADLANVLDIAESEVIVMTPASPMTWSSSAMGCARPGDSYRPGPFGGFNLLLAFFDRTYPYHQGGSEAPFLCEAPTE